MMFKSMVALALVGAMSAPSVAGPAPATTQPATTQPATTKPQVVKKRVCETVDEDSYSRLGKRKICRTVEVTVNSPAGAAADPQQAPEAKDEGK